MSESKSLFHRLAETYDDYRAERRAAAGVAPAPRPNRLGRFLRWMVPNGGTILVVLALLLTQQGWARPVPQHMHVPGPSATTVNYQGRLADPDGNPLDGNYGMTFSLWDAPSGGALVWGPENHPAVPVSQGLFSVGLGSQTSGGIPTTAWNGDRYLEIIVGGETLSPRELIRSVPIAGMALTVPDGAITTDKVADGSVTAEKLGFFLPQLLGVKTCDNCGQPTESNLPGGWYAVKGMDSQDIIEVTAITQGGAVMVHMTSRYQFDPAGVHWCGIEVLQGGSQVRLALLEGDVSVASSNWGCSGTYLFTDLPPGTYTFRAVAYCHAVTSLQWTDQRQIAVYEYEY